MTSWLIWLLPTSALAVATATMWLTIRNSQEVGVEPSIGVFAPLPSALIIGVGTLVAVRARNVIGWLLATVGGLILFGLFTEAYTFYGLLSVPRELPGLMTAARVTYLWDFALGFAVAAVLLLFPTGRLPSKRWRPVLWGLIGGAVVSTVVVASSPGGLESRLNDFGVVLDNPSGLSLPEGSFDAAITASVALLFAGGLASLVAIAIRFHRASGQERQQIKWLAYLAITAATLMLTSSVLGAFLDIPGVVEGLWVLGLFGFIAGFPITVGMAVLRYGLYEIDLVVNRTLVYGALTLSLVGLYVGGILGLQAAFRAATGQESNLAIVVSTLGIAAVFRPLQGQIQGVIDRRLYRRKYNAERTLAAFGSRVRDEVELRELAIELTAVVRETMQPAHVSLWLRPEVDNR